MMIETDTRFIPSDGASFQFNGNPQIDDYVPSTGRLVWLKRRPFSKKKYFYGIQFQDVDKECNDRLRQRIQQGIIQQANSRRIQVLFKAGMLILAIMMFVYTLILGWQAIDSMKASNQSWVSTSNKQSELQNISQLKIASLQVELEATKELYEQTQQMLHAVTGELDTTKNVLAETEKMLGDARGEISKLKAMMAQMEAKYGQQITELESRNTELTNELAALKAKIDYYEGNVKDMQEAKEWMQMYKSRLRFVKSRISFFKKEAQVVRKAAQKEKDRIRLMLGNNGYLVRDGKPVDVDQEKYDAAGSEPSKAKIDVKVFR
jgi:hypothetical protein